MGEIIDFFIHLNWTGLVIPLVIDIGIIVYFVKGYNQGKGDGLIMSSIDLLSFLLVIIMAVLFAEPAVIKIRSMAGRNELIRKHVVSWITPFRMFIILLIALAILFYFINKLVKGPLKGTITKVKIISKVNDFLGGLFGLLKRFFIVYIIVSLLMLQNFMPFVKQEIKQTGV
ncbi:MAG: CvpA family protein, partial [bacterium]